MPKKSAGKAGLTRAEAKIESITHYIVLSAPVMCEKMRKAVYNLNWMRVEELIKGGHDFKAEWKGRTIFLLALDGYRRKHNRIQLDTTINDRVRKTKIYNLEKDLDWFSTCCYNYRSYLEALSERPRKKRK